MTETRAQSRHNEYTTPDAREAKSGARFVPACDYQDRFTEPPHRATEARHAGTRMREPYPCLRHGRGTARSRAPRQRPPHPAPVAQWIEQAPSKRLAAGSSPAGGATSCQQEHPRGGLLSRAFRYLRRQHRRQRPRHSPDRRSPGRRPEHPTPPPGRRAGTPRNTIFGTSRRRRPPPPSGLNCRHVTRGVESPQPFHDQNRCYGFTFPSLDRYRQPIRTHLTGSQ